MVLGNIYYAVKNNRLDYWIQENNRTLCSMGVKIYPHLDIEQVRGSPENLIYVWISFIYCISWISWDIFYALNPLDILNFLNILDMLDILDTLNIFDTLDNLKILDIFYTFSYFVYP